MKTVRACDQQMEDFAIQADGEYYGAAGLEPWGSGSIGLLGLRIEIDRACIITPLHKAGGGVPSCRFGGEVRGGHLSNYWAWYIYYEPRLSPGIQSFKFSL